MNSIMFSKAVKTTRLVLLVALFFVLIGSSATFAKAKLYIKGGNVVPDLAKGQKYSIKGKIVSPSYLRRVEIGVVKAKNGKWVKKSTYDKKVKTKKFNIKKADKKVVFSKLKSGDYYYRIYAHTRAKVRCLVNQPFSVGEKKTKEEPTLVTPTSGSSSKGNTSETNTSVRIEGFTAPANGIVGTKFQAAGIITSESNISKVIVGAVNPSNGKWVKGVKYTKKNINSTSFDMSTIAKKVKPEYAAPGNYYYRISVYLSDEDYVDIVNSKFKVTAPSTNEEAIEAACRWAENIANDNSFTYGTTKRAHHNGCYFCGTNAKKKGSSLLNGHSFDKTYCCNPFVTAAFAHGACDPNVLAACKNCTGVAMSKRSFTRYKCFKSMGKPSYSALQRGDVLVKNTHVVLYLGDGKMVHAGREGWGASSITITDCKSSYYKTFKFVMRYTGEGVA